MNEQRFMVEFLFVRIFLLKSFWKFLMLYEPIPFEYLAFMQREMRKRVPEMNQNPIIRQKADMQLLTIAMETEWTPEFLLALREQMVSLLKDNKINPGLLWLDFA